MLLNDALDAPFELGLELAFVVVEATRRESIVAAGEGWLLGEICPQRLGNDRDGDILL